jgi:hypothetical protein
VLAFCGDSSKDVRDFVLAVLWRHALTSQVAAGWASSSRLRGRGQVHLLPEALLLESADTVLAVPLDGVVRVGSCKTLGPGGSLYVRFQSNGEEVAVVVCLEEYPLMREPSAFLGPWYESVIGAVRALRGRRQDLGARGLTPMEGEEVGGLVAGIPAAHKE